MTEQEELESKGRQRQKLTIQELEDATKLTKKGKEQGPDNIAQNGTDKVAS